ncbi:MAG TPA: hypothetical protein VI197_22670 [Polyangiaceae bacterium]
MSIGSWKRWVVVSTAVLLLSLVSVPANSALEVSLEYAVPSGIGCPSEAEFRAAVAERLDTDPFVPGAARTVAVEISAKGGKLTGWLRWVDREGALEGQRRFEAQAADCAGLARNMVFAVTVQLQLLGRPEQADTPAEAKVPESDTQVGRTPPAPPTATATATTTSTSTSTSTSTATSGAPASAPAASATETFEVGAGLGPFVVSGWAPDVTAGGRVMVVGRLPRVLLQIAFEASLPQRHETSDDGSGFESSVLAASVAPCYRWPGIDTCPVFRAGQVRAQGFGVDQPQSPRATLWEIGLRLGAGGALWQRLEAKAHLELSYTLSPWTVQLNQHPVFVAPSFVFLGGIDLIAFFL